MTVSVAGEAIFPVWTAQLAAFSARLKTRGSSDPKRERSQSVARNAIDAAADDALGRSGSRACVGLPATSTTAPKTSAGRRNPAHFFSWLFSTRNILKLYGMRRADESTRRAVFSVACRRA